MNIRCEKCGQVYEVGPEYAGQRVECQCGAKMIVPAKKADREMDVKFKIGGQTYRPDDIERAVRKSKNGTAEAFRVPKIAKWIYGTGQIMVAAGIVFTIFGIIAVCADGARKLFYPITFIAVMLSGIFVMGTGKALEYLAEIAYNTRQK